MGVGSRADEIEMVVVALLLFQMVMKSWDVQSISSNACLISLQQAFTAPLELDWLRNWRYWVAERNGISFDGMEGLHSPAIKSHPVMETRSVEYARTSLL